MKSRYLVTFAVLFGASTLPAYADRDTGWEFGGELIYQDSQNFDSDGGSSAKLDSDLGIALTFGYRFNEKFELNFGLDWNNIDYNAHLVNGTTPGLSVDVDGEMEVWTPRIGATFNFMDGPITPYVNATIGYSFIDTNIPNGPPVSSCWWDPWYGYICDTWQPTFEDTAFSYGAAAGVRAEVNERFFIEGSYNVLWLDLDKAGTQSLDGFRVNFGWTF